MPVFAIIGLVLILAVIVLLVVRRKAGGDNDGNKGRMPGTHQGGTDKL